MSEQETDSCGLLLFFFLILLSGKVAVGESLDKDKEVLLKLKFYLDSKILADRGGYIYWNANSSNPCEWKGISCSATKRVNTLSGEIPEDLRHCHKLVHLNLSHNILEGELNLTGLIGLRTLDLSNNRFYGDIGLNFPSICANLVVANVSEYYCWLSTNNTMVTKP